MEYNPFALQGKTILVTGASSGIGRSIAIECSRMGAVVYISGRNINSLNETLSLMKDGPHQIITADLTDEESISILVDNLPLLNGVVQNAGMLERMLCKAAKAEKIEKLMKTNFEGPVLLQKLLLKKNKIEKSGSVVFVSSRAPFAPSIGNAFYSATKGAILGYAKTLALEVAPKQIRVNSICPAMVWTELAKKDAEQMSTNYEEAEQKYPLKRFGKPEDVAYLAVYLLSDASSWMTGSQIDITGGGELTLV